MVSGRLVGIDIGTSGLKVSIFDEAGAVASQSYREASYLPLPPGQMEQSPERWRDALYDALREAAGNSSGEIAAVGVCGLQHLPVFLDKNLRPSRTVIQLHDQRLLESHQQLVKSGALERIEALTKSMISAAHFPPVFHHVAQNDPSGLERTRWILSAKDYLRFTLTGEIGAEICDATGMNLVEPNQSNWSEEICKILGVPIEALPEIRSPSDIAGRVTKEASAATGLPVGTPVVFGGGDSHCALLGLGCIENGHTGMLLGTNSTLRSVFDRFVSHPEIKLWGQRHVVPDRHTISASSMAGASVVNWFKQSFLPRLSEERFAQIERSAADLPAGADGLTFLPFIHGERCPFLRPDATGAFAGVRAGHKAPHFLRAVIEGIALNIACCFDMIGECAGPLDTDIKEIKLAGGGSRSPLMRQIISDCLNKPIRIMNAEEAGTLGAAMLAGIGSGIYADCREAVAAVVRERETIEPDAVRNVQYAELKSNFTDLCGRIL